MIVLTGDIVPVYNLGPTTTPPDYTTRPPPYQAYHRFVLLCCYVASINIIILENASESYDSYSDVVDYLRKPSTPAPSTCVLELLTISSLYLPLLNQVCAYWSY